MKFSDEPAVYIGILEALLAVLVAFGLNLSAEQIGAIMALATAIGAVVIRQNVTPVRA